MKNQKTNKKKEKPKRYVPVNHKTQSKGFKVNNRNELYIADGKL